MTPYYSTPEKQQAYVQEALSWRGTAWRANSRAKGRVVDCGNLQAEIHKTTGALPASFVTPPVQSAVAGQRTLARMRQLLEPLPEFIELDLAAALIPGDMLVFKVAGVEYHLAGYLGFIDGQHGMLCSSITKLGVCYPNLKDPTWSRHITGLWRVVA
ncbi:MAG: hypothetical protein AAGF10_05395 [Verrucomicrobiota bacterium]